MWTDVLIIEDHPPESSAALTGLLESADVAVTRRRGWAAGGAPVDLTSCREKLIVLNTVPPTAEALDLFLWLREHSVNAAILAILPPDDPEFSRIAAAAVDDFLFWPVRGLELRQRILRLLGPRSGAPEELLRGVARQAGIEKIVGEAPAFAQALSSAALFGASDAPVILTGETGTGKELFARLIHLLSRRRNGPFVPVECGCLPEHVFENEVFGHVRGAFTDAHGEQKGLVALANRGTLFLDEIDSLSVGMQGKLLRLLQERMFRPLGSDKFCEADVRVIAATNRDLASLVKEKLFREDLFFRLDVLRVQLPPLRDRPSDIPLLARQFFAEIAAKEGAPRKMLAASALRKLESHSWPGNVRELYNALHRAVLSSTGAEVLPMHIELKQSAEKSRAAGAGQTEHAAGRDLEDFRSEKLRAIERFEKTYVAELLDQHGGNVTRAAGAARKDRRAFGRLVKKYDIRGRRG